MHPTAVPPQDPTTDGHRPPTPHAPPADRDCRGSWFGLRLSRPLLALAATLALTACGEPAKLTLAQGSGPNPALPAPGRSLVPVVQVAKAVGWAADGQPLAAEGLSVQAFARGLQHPRWLYTLPNGDVLVAESNAPARESGGIKAWIQAMFMARAGAGVPSADRITLLRDADGDGRAEFQTVLIDGLHAPFGMAWIDGRLYVANTDAVVAVPYSLGTDRISQSPTQLAPLPALPINHHWTKNLIASPDGTRLYITVGSNSNIAENGIEAEQGRAAIHELVLATGQLRLFATGLRNPNGLAWVPAADGQAPVLWTVVNERDELGSDLVPDYLTSVRDGGFYGWPWRYFGEHVDTRVKPPPPANQAEALRPDFALGPHVAPLGLHWLQPGTALHERLGAGMVIGQHGSWNRQPPSGYNVVFVPFSQGRPSGLPLTLLAGFLSPDGETAQGRPVGVAQDGRGSLLVADDVGNTIWRVRVGAP